LIDLKLELQDYHAINLKDIAQDEADISDNIRNSVILYNKAIESLRSGSEDIAIIELKKAVSMNPNFYEAMNLLGICYSYINDNAKAAEIFERVVKAEHNSVKAMKYLNQLNSSDDTLSGRMKARKKPAVPDEALKKEVSLPDLKKIKLQNIIRILAGFAAGALLFTAIALLNPDSGRNPDVPANTGDVADKSAEELQQYKTMYDELNAKYELLQKDKEDANKAADYYKSVIKLYEIESQAAKKQYESAAEMLLLMKTVEFRDADRQKFDDLYGTVMPKAAQIAYDDGYKLYNQKKYEDSLKKLDKVQVYDPEFGRMDAVLYYMGRCSQLLNDSRSAIALFQKLIGDYPKSSYAKNAKVRLEDLTKMP
jgi:tetratricopeptide (TPR) repeat protein